VIALYTALALVVGVAVAARRPVGGRKNPTDVFGGTEHEAVQAGTRWAAEVLAAGRISASEQPLAALRELRRANRALSLTGAKVLLDQLLPPH